MATPASDKLKFRMTSKDVGSLGAAITTRTTTGLGANAKEIIASALPGAAGYWAGAIGWFLPDTTTVALRGVFFHVRTYDDVSTLLTVSKTLPATPAVGDTFKIVLGSDYVSSADCFGLQLDSAQPELFPVTGSNITGVSIKYVSGQMGEGTLTLTFNQTAGTLTAKIDAEADGAALDVSGNVTDGVIKLGDGVSYIVVDVVAASLPVANQVDTFTVTRPAAAQIPDFEAWETGADKQRYHTVFLENTDVDSMLDLVVWCGKPAGSNTTVATGNSVSVAAGSASLTDASDHPAGSYWLYNSTKDDLRYVTTRSGNVIAWVNAGTGHRGKTATSWDAGDDVLVYPDFDIGLEAPTAGQIDSPATETTAPTGVTFSAPFTVDTGLSVGTLAASGVYAVRYRETIVQNHLPRSGIVYDLFTRWS
jgi:hypothetical protein